MYHGEDSFGTREELYIRAIGRQIVNWAKDCCPGVLAQQVNADAILLLGEIQQILNDETLNDPECFYRIDAIVSAFHRPGISTARHWEVE